MSEIKTFNCSMELTLDLMGGKWKPIIILYIGNKEPIRYGELRRLIPNINERVLSRELKELERTHIINRQAFDEKVLRVEYSLTKDGEKLLPILKNLTQWGNEYNKVYKYADIRCSR